MPRHPKPVPLRANREHRDIGIVPRQSRQEPQPAPTGLLATSKASWDQFWSSPLAQTIVPATDLDTLRRLWSLKDERERMYRALQKERMVRGSRGQPRANPLYAQMVSLDAAIERLEDRFGLSPRSRLQLGVVLGDAARSLADLNSDLEDDTDLEALYSDPVILDRDAG